MEEIGETPHSLSPIPHNLTGFPSLPSLVQNPNP